jgi:ubiquinone/menaquinone biosynthesis C-methylase UbiE
MKTWEEVILDIRTSLEFKDLVRLSYLEEDLHLNVKRFKDSEEFHETIKWIKHYSSGNTILDIGAGNGISSISFALNGYAVTSLEPDQSNTVGSGAIRKLALDLNLSSVTVIEGYAEKLPFMDNAFDILYARQSMHHAQDLSTFIKEAYRVLKKGGILFTLRDHVVDNEIQKSEFLSGHPLHKFYGGENAFSKEEYLFAMRSAGFNIKKILGPYDSIINLFPTTKENIYHRPLPSWLFKLLCRYYKFRTNNMSYAAGRLYSFLAQK